MYTSEDIKILEVLPSNIPRDSGEGFTMYAYVDSNYAGDLVTMTVIVIATAMMRINRGTE